MEADWRRELDAPTPCRGAWLSLGFGSAALCEESRSQTQSDKQPHPFVGEAMARSHMHVDPTNMYVEVRDLMLTMEAAQDLGKIGCEELGQWNQFISTSF